MQLFNLLLVQPITNILVLLYHALTMLGLPYALGFAIIALTVIIRFLLYPITTQQLKTSKKMQELTPHLADLKKKHKDDPKKLQQETMQLYSKHGVNPLAGCLPTILQMIVLFGLYAVLSEISKDPQSVLKHINSLVYFPELQLTRVWDTTFFGLPLIKKPSELLGSVGLLILLVPVLTGVLQFIQSAMMFGKPAEKADKKEAKDTATDFASAMQNNTLYILPVMIGYFSYTFPLALALYWNTFTIFGIIQQYRVGGLGRVADWRNRFFPTTAAKGNKESMMTSSSQPSPKRKRK
jgi:YidC/Oxa1 family membrane protein insertase